MPRVSVVIPSYNHAAFIAQAVRSVLAQTESDLELIVVDDGSSDDSLVVLASLVEPRLTVIEQTNQGAHAAINRGLSKASGKYLAILNSDDVYHPQRLEKLVNILETNPEIGLIGSYIEVIDRAGNHLGVKEGYRTQAPWPLAATERSFRAEVDLRAALLTENYWATTSNFVLRRTWYERLGSFRPLRYTHDWDFALRMAQTAPLVLHPEPLLSYRVHDSNTIRENEAAMIFEICWCLAVHLPQHVATPWFYKQPLAKRIDQLLHSIYTFGVERVLSVMLLQKLDENLEIALHLLEPDDPCRASYLEFITHHLATSTPPAAPQTTEKTGQGPNRSTQSVVALTKLVTKLKTHLREL